MTNYIQVTCILTDYALDHCVRRFVQSWLPYVHAELFHPCIVHGRDVRYDSLCRLLPL